MLKSFILLSFLLTPFPLLSADELDDFLEGENDYYDLEESSLQSPHIIDKLSKRRKKTYAPIPYKIKEIPRKKYWTPSPYTALLKKNSPIQNIKSKKWIALDREVYVRVEQESSESSLLYILDKKGLPKYKIDAVHSIDVTKDFKLLPTEDFSIVYGPKTSNHFTDKFFILETDFSYHYETSSSSYYKNIYRGESTKSSGNRFEFKSYLRSFLPAHFGIVLNYNVGTWVDDKIGQAAYQSTFLGPGVKFEVNNKFAIYLSVLKSISHKTEKYPDEHHYSSTAWQLDMDYKIFDNWSLGFGYKIIKSSVEDTTEFLFKKTERGDTKTFSLLIGYRTDWIL